MRQQNKVTQQQHLRMGKTQTGKNSKLGTNFGGMQQSAVMNDLTSMGFTTTAKGGRVVNGSKNLKTKSSKHVSDAPSLKTNNQLARGTSQNTNSQVFYPKPINEDYGKTSMIEEQIKNAIVPSHKAGSASISNKHMKNPSTSGTPS